MSDATNGGTDWSEQVAVLMDAHANPTIDAGRNVKGGYARGLGLEYGRLAEFCLQDPVYRGALAHADLRQSLCVPHKLMNLYLIIRYGLENVSGDVIELGSYRGGSAVFMAAVMRALGRTSRVWALDSFEGMPPTDATRDAHRQGDFSDTSYEDLVDYVAASGLDSHLTIVKGFFDRTLKGVAERAQRFALVHVDCDIYEAVKHSVRTLENHVAIGAYVVFDDPLHGSCIGAMQAVEEELISRLGLRAEQTYPHLVYRMPRLAQAPAGRHV